MTEIADVVVIGAGIQGASAAYQLCLRDTGRVLVLEQGMPGRGATAASAAMIMHQTGSAFTTELAQRSLCRYDGLHDELGVDIGLTRTGSVLFSASAVGRDRLAAVADHQRSLGIVTETLSEEHLHKQSGGLLAAGAGLTGIHCPADGYVDAQAVVDGYLSAAQRHGAEVRERARVATIALDGDRVVGVETDDGSMIATECVVNCAGPWAREIGAQIGVALPIRRNQRNMIILKRHGASTTEIFPILEDFDHEWYFRHHDTGVLLGIGPTSWVVDGTIAGDPIYDAQYEPATQEYLTRYAPSLLPVTKLEQWAGHRPMIDPAMQTADGTPDDLPIIGGVPGLAGYFQSCGWGAFGVTLAPVGGELIAQMICQETPAVDVTPVRWERFSDRFPRYDLEAGT
jgi:sarcosine oxidase, subunit beta